MKAVASIVLLTVLTVFCQAAAQTSTEASEQKPGLAMKPASDDYTVAAIRSLREKLAANPNDNVSQLQLTTMLFKAKKYSEVIVEGEKALAEFPNRMGLIYQVGESYRQLRKPTTALSYLARGYNLMTQPYTELAASYAMTLLRLGNVKDATPVIQKAAKDDTTFVRLCKIAGDEAYRLKDMEFAADEYYSVWIVDKSLLTDDQKLFVRFTNDFQSLLDSNNSAAATTAFVEYMKKKMGDNLDYDLLGAAFASMVKAKQAEKARALYIEMNRLKPQSVTQDTLDVRFLSLAYALAANDPEIISNIRIAFIRSAKSVLKSGDAEVKPIYGLHEFVLTQGSFNSAADITTALINAAAGPESVYVRLADIFLQYKKPDEAVGTFSMMLGKKMLDSSGYGPDLTAMYGRLVNEPKTAAEARELMLSINKLPDHDIRASYACAAEIFTKAGDFEKAIVLLTRLLRADPANIALTNRLGDAFLASGRYDDIISTFDSVKTKEGRKYLALAYEKKYLMSEANKTWEEFRKASSDPAEAAEAKKHINENIITMMSPDFSRLQAEANKPKADTSMHGKFSIVLDSPKDGLQTSASTVDLTGEFVGAVTLQDVKLNGQSLGTARGMKAVDPQTEQTEKRGLPFVYTVPLQPGTNAITLEAVAADGQTARKHVTIVMGSGEPGGKMLTIEEADGIRQNKAYAVIVGVGNYQSKEIAKLDYARNDAEELARVLTDPLYGGFDKDHVTVLTDKNATIQNIKKAIGTGLKRAPEDGIAIVYFAGHGATEDEVTYFLPYEADPASLFGSALPNSEIKAMLERISASKVVAFMDACYSGAALKGAKSTRAVLIDDPFKSFEGSGMVTVTSSDGKQQSLEDASLKHGIFTYRLIEAIKGKADLNSDGIVMADEIAKYVSMKVPEDARERSHKQQPMVITEYKGVIPISRNAENVMKNSKLQQIQVFEKMLRDDQISASDFKKIKDILNGTDAKLKKRVVDFLNKDLTFEELISVVGK